MQNLQNELTNLLSSENNFVIDGQLNKNKVAEAALKVEPQLLKLLIGNETFKKHFFQDIEGILIFDKIAFQRFVNNKSFLPDSYTAFKNKIGLTINDGTTDNYITTRNDVTLVWPHKDCVLEGGQTKEDQKRNEIFWNETLAPDSVDRLLSPKAFTNFKKYDKEGEHTANEITGDENLILKGNNLLCLNSLLRTHRGKIKLIYIDPPYNTGSDSFMYNDNFNHSTWLTFMKNRLEVAKELLRIDGSIYISIDDNEVGYLQVLLDEIFGHQNNVGIISVKRGSVTGHKAINPGTVNITEYLVVFCKNKEHYSPNKVYRKRERNDRYNVFIKNRLEDKSKWQFVSLLDAFAEYCKVEKTQVKKALGNNFENKLWKFISENSDAVIQFAYPDKDKVSKETKELILNSKNDIENIYHLERQNEPDIYLYKGQRMLFYSDRLVKIDGELVTGETLSNFWSDVLPNDLHNEGGVSLKKGKKPEKLIQRIIQLETVENDIVLDYHLGSGTTTAVAHKMNRKYIGIEQLDYEENDSVQRMKNVIEGEQGGISKSVDWQGGGSFVYSELLQYNQAYIDEIQVAESEDELIAIWHEMEKEAFLLYQFDKKAFKERLAAFKSAPIELMKQFLVEVLDKNQLYVNYSEIEDETYKVSSEDIALNKKFYAKR